MLIFLLRNFCRVRGKKKKKGNVAGYLGQTETEKAQPFISVVRLTTKASEGKKNIRARYTPAAWAKTAGKSFSFSKTHQTSLSPNRWTAAVFAVSYSWASCPTTSLRAGRTASGRGRCEKSLTLMSCRHGDKKMSGRCPEIMTLWHANDMLWPHEGYIFYFIFY